MTQSLPADAAETYTTLEAARHMGLAVRSVQLMVDRGELTAWKTPGGHRRISRESVHRWISQKRGEQPVADGREAETSRRAKSTAWTRLPDGAPRKPTVLLIEDSVHYQNLLRLVITQQFPEVDLHVAADGISGLVLAGRLDPAVLIVDILLPGIDGAALITGLRTQAQFDHSRLIVVTSLDAAQREPYAFALKGVPVVQKADVVTALPPLLQEALAPHGPTA